MPPRSATPSARSTPCAIQSLVAAPRWGRAQRGAACAARRHAVVARRAGRARLPDSLPRPARTLRRIRSGLTAALSIASTIVLLGGAALAHPAAAAAEAAPTHVVEPGETLWRIAHQAGVDVATLRRLNGLAEDDVLVAGRRLVLPSAVTQPVSPTPSARAEARHTVAPGETVWRIARQYGTSVAAVLAANGLEHAEQLRAGAEIRVPDGRPEPTAPAAPAPQQATAAAGYSFLVVLIQVSL